MQNYILHVASETGKRALLNGPDKRVGDVLEGSGEHCRRGHADAVQHGGGLVADVQVVVGTGRGAGLPVAALVDVHVVAGAAGTRAVVVALGEHQRVVAVEVGALLHAVAAVESLQRVVEVDVGVVGGQSVAADRAADTDRLVDLVGVAVEVRVDGAVDHGRDVGQEQQAAEHVAALAVVLVHGSCFHVLEVRLLFSFTFSSHLKMYNV